MHVVLVLCIYIMFVLFRCCMSQRICW